MSANAPYYQMRTSQPSTDTYSSSAAGQSDTLQDGDYGLTTMEAVERATGNQHLPAHSENAARRPGAVSQHNDVEENRNLAELLEAATTAADQDHVAMHPPATESAVPHANDQNKRKRASNIQTDAHASIEPIFEDNERSTMKRRCINTSSTDPNLRPHESDTVMCSPASKNSPSPSRNLLVDARAAGVHSAAALFRRTSTNTTRKYTRPPMSKLFMSLNISPENFIALQSLAKTYMLSPAHPDRQSCVGNRGKGDTDMVKLRLFNCVRDFLADSVGGQFFGEHVAKPGEKENSEAAAALGEKEGGSEKLVWPRDGNKIISLVTPLMRRMVTNERQRLYAIDTRKGGKKTEKESSTEAQSVPGTPAHDVHQHQQTVLDPTLQRPATRVISPSTPPPMNAHTFTVNFAPPTSNPPAFLSPTAVPPPSPTDASEPNLTNINVFLIYNPSTTRSVKIDEKRISTTRPAHLSFYNYTAFIEQVNAMVGRVELLHPSIKHAAVTSDGVGDTESLRGLAAAANALQPDKDDQHLKSSASANYTIKTIGPSGWQVIDSAQTWYHVLTERAFAMWADGVCNIIVELGATQVVRKAERASEGMSGEVQMEDA
ncbi:uncharacterized protein M421DRAFT_415085 [Didymella exigua CBS 183.55]|uniref:Uncharacterized protein n=1 Tax=Didymella exigua CBS 183.55 TaxID=1150837 RepID=A0A6A5S989_9PLEO|nr:uncharacterized protein M421DRAFT_415085 [Didymella exigua CBS 183.55]KAF1934037.1 hypothetical protein M421DRAFT_415085 [Didymella exigua CBS 183.55]